MRRREVMREIARVIRPHAHFIVFTVLFAVAVVAGQLLAPFFAGQAIDGIAAGDGGATARSLWALGISAGGAALFQWLLSLANNALAYRVLRDVRREAFRKIGTLPLKYIDSRPYGDVSGVVVSDAEQFAEGLLLGATQLFTGVLTIAGVLGIMLAVRWEIALVVFCITPLSFFAARFIASRTYRTVKRQAELRADETAFADEMISNLKVVKAFTREEENERIFREKNEALRQVSLRAVFFSSTTNPVTRFVNSLVYAAVAFAGALFVIATGGVFTVGQLGSFLSYANQYTRPFNEISEVVAEFQNALACAGRIFALSREEDEPSDRGNRSLGAAKGDVSLRSVRFGYGEKLLFDGLDAEVKAGMRVALVGPTGCGKTTLVNLLMRFYDVSGGEVCVDGEDVRALTRESLRRNIGMVLQETWIKTGTVRENLCLGREDCTEEEMIAAAKAARAHAFIERLPKGYDTVIDDEGSLSQGQKQLLCIARVMVCRPPMLILDEATSNIDTRTERAVQEAFAELMRGRTCFVVAHRLSTVRSCDRILVMRDGRIVERGTHEELLRLGGFYAELYRAQFAGQ